MNEPVLGVIGLGFVGQPTVAALANVGYQVVGMDIESEKVNSLKKSVATIYEPGLNETLRRTRKNCRFTTDFEEMMDACDAVLITVGTPLDENNVPDYTGLNTVVKQIAKFLRTGQTIILRSTVSPGTTRKVAEDLEACTDMKCGRDFFLSFCPERTIEGLALYELYNLPKIIGGINPESSEKTKEILKRLGGKVVTVSSATVAELCKLADNMYRALNIAFANEFGNICESAKVDAYEVVNAVNSTYGRTSIFRPGLGASGPCLSKDPIILSHFADGHGVKTPIVDSCVSVNINSNLRVVQDTEDFLESHGLNRPRIAILGLAFKGMPETDDSREAPAAIIFRALRNGNNSKSKRERDFSFYDPLIEQFEGKTTAESMEECMRDANVVLFLNDHAILRHTPLEYVLENTARPLLIFDAWHNVTKPTQVSLPDSVELIQIGAGK